MEKYKDAIKVQAINIPLSAEPIIDILSKEQVGVIIGNVFRWLNDEPIRVMDLPTEIAFLAFKAYLEAGNIYYGITEDVVNNPNADRQNPLYKEFRKDVLKRDHYKCVICGSEDNLHVHHVKSYKDYPKLRLDPDNAVTLCAECHYEEHRK